MFRSSSAETIDQVFPVGYSISNALTFLQQKGRSTPVEVEKETDSARKEMDEAVPSQRALYARYKEMIKEDNQQSKKLLEKQEESAWQQKMKICILH